jgi:hypothetical protein
MKLRIRLPADPQPIVVEVPDDTQLQDINTAIAGTVGKPAKEFVWLAGVPPKRMRDEDALKTVKEAWRNGEILNIQAVDATVKEGHTNGKYVPPIEVRNSVFKRLPMPGDNSCLFHSLGWIFDKTAIEVRQMVGALIRANPEKWNAGILGMQPEAYIRQMQNPNNWGGYVEIALLSDCFATEIVILDMTSKRPQIIGEGNGYTTRSFVFFTGNHYDAGAVGSTMEGHIAQKQFSTTDSRPMALAKDYLEGRVKESGK